MVRFSLRSMMLAIVAIAVLIPGMLFLFDLACSMQTKRNIEWTQRYIDQRGSCEYCAEERSKHCGLTRLFLYNEKIPQRFWQGMRCEYRLEALSLSWCQINRFDFLQRFPCLRLLILEGTSFSNSDIEYVRDLQQLETIWICDCKGIDIDGLIELLFLNNIEKIRVSPGQFQWADIPEKYRSKILGYQEDITYIPID